MNTLRLPSFLKIFLKGISQIMLMESAVTGLLFLVGVWYSSWQMGVGLVLGTLVGTLAGFSFRSHRRELSMGLYGFNGALVGTAAIFGLGLNVLSFLVILAGAALSTYLMHVAIRSAWRVFTFPFILSSWLLISLLGTALKPIFVPEQAARSELAQAHTDAVMSPDRLEEEEEVYFEEEGELEDYFEEWEDRLDDLDDLGEDEFFNSLTSYGQVIFQGSLFTGLLFLLGVFYKDPIAAVFGVFGSVLAIMVSHILKVEDVSIYQGLMGFNAVLCAITFAGPKRRDGVAVAFSCSLSVFIYIVMIDLGIPPYTFPFVLATWIVILLRKIPEKISRNRHRIG